jgi:hypothetical protein
VLRVALLSLAMAATSAAAADFILPSPEVGPARGEEVRAAAAGGLFLVAWIDSRGICFARIDAGGTLLDRLPTVVAPKTDATRNLIAAGGDHHWTLFWYDGDLRAARIGLDGRPIDAEPRRFEGALAGFSFDLVPDGGGFALLNDYGRLYAIDGNLDSIRQIANIDYGGSPLLAANGNGYLAALDFRLTFLDAAGHWLRESKLPVRVESRRLESAGGVYMVAWTDTDNGETLTVASFDGKGQPLVPPRIISTPLTAAGRAPITFAMTANGAGTTIVSEEIDYDDVPQPNRLRVARFATNGSPIETRIIDSDRGRSVLALASAGAANLLVTLAPGELVEGRLFESVAAFPAEPQVPSIIFREHDLATSAIAATNAGFAAAWLEIITPSSIEERTRKAVHFVATGAEAMELDRGDLQDVLTIASDGDTALAGWVNNGELRARLLRRGAPSRDIAVPAGTVRELVSAWTGRVFLLVWHDDAGVMHSLTVSPFGDASQPLEVASNVSTALAGDLSLACNGRGCVAAGTFWPKPTPYEPGITDLLDLLTVRFDENGSPVAPAHRKTIVSNGMRTKPFFDSRGNAFVLFGSVMRVSGAAIAPLADDGAVASPETGITATFEGLRLATGSGFYSIRLTPRGARLMWTWITLTPQPAVIGSVDLGPSVGAVAARGGSAFALVRLGPSTLAVRDIPPPSTKRRRTA